MVTDGLELTETQFYGNSEAPKLLPAVVPETITQPKISPESRDTARLVLETLKGKKEVETTPGREILVFGQGPIVDRVSRDRAEDAKDSAGLNIPKGQEDINFLSIDLARAGASLNRLTNVKQFTVMGGQTGGSQYASEAKLLAKEMQELGVPVDSIQTEERSNDTIENIVNFLNLYDKDGEDPQKKSYDVLCSPFHAVRLRVLMKLFAVPVGDVFRSDDVLRVAYQQGQGDTTKLLNELDARLDLDRDESSKRHELPTDYYVRQKGKETRRIEDRYIKDDLWTRELIERPAKWLPNVGTIENDARVNVILKQVESLYPGMLRNDYGIDLNAKMSQVKQKLRNVQAVPLTAQEVNTWVEENKTGSWPLEVMGRVNTLLYGASQQI